jgi:hypothetical protein
MDPEELCFVPCVQHASLASGRQEPEPHLARSQHRAMAHRLNLCPFIPLEELCTSDRHCVIETVLF